MAHREIAQTNHEPPTQHVLEEAHKIIGLLDSGNRAATAAALREDLQTMSPKDTRDLLLTVMNKEAKYQGNDLELFGHSKDEIAALNKQTDRERQNLGMMMRDATVDQRKAAFAEFNKTHQEQLENYKKEISVFITKERQATPEEQKKGVGIVTIGDSITVGTYRLNKEGLPDFRIVGDGK